MKISTRTRYGTRALVDLALHADDGPVSVAQIAERQEVSEKYLESVLAMLRQAGMVQSVRGAGGGHVLARDAAQINLRDVFVALEGADGLVECTKNAGVCSRSARCVTRGVWASVYHRLLQQLEAITIQELADEAMEKQRANPQMYYI